MGVIRSPAFWRPWETEGLRDFWIFIACAIRLLSSFVSKALPVESHGI